jgi:hypothetical protein
MINFVVLAPDLPLLTSYYCEIEAQVTTSFELRARPYFPVTGLMNGVLPTCYTARERRGESTC